MLEEHHPVEPLLFSPRTINYTQNANPMTDCGVYITVFTLATVAVLTNGKPQSDAGEIPKRIHTIFKTWRKFEIVLILFSDTGIS